MNRSKVVTICILVFVASGALILLSGFHAESGLLTRPVWAKGFGRPLLDDLPYAHYQGRRRGGGQIEPAVDGIFVVLNRSEEQANILSNGSASVRLFSRDGKMKWVRPVPVFGRDMIARSNAQGLSLIGLSTTRSNDGVVRRSQGPLKYLEVGNDGEIVGQFDLPPTFAYAYGLKRLERSVLIVAAQRSEFEKSINPPIQDARANAKLLSFDASGQLLWDIDLPDGFNCVNLETVEPDLIDVVLQSQKEGSVEIYRIDADGKLLWKHEIAHGGVDLDCAQGDGLGHLYLAGFIESSVKLNSRTVPTHRTPVGDWPYCIFLARYDSNGDCEWSVIVARQIQFNEQMTPYILMDIGENGKCLIGGTFFKSVEIGEHDDAGRLKLPWLSDFRTGHFLACYDETGHLLGAASIDNKYSSTIGDLLLDRKSLEFYTLGIIGKSRQESGDRPMLDLGERDPAEKSSRSGDLFVVKRLLEFGKD